MVVRQRSIVTIRMKTQKTCDVGYERSVLARNARWSKKISSPRDAQHIFDASMWFITTPLQEAGRHQMQILIRAVSEGFTAWHGVA